MASETSALSVGKYIRDHVIPDGLSVKDAAARLAVGRPALSNLLNGKSALSPDMAVRLEKSFGADRQKLLDMQAASDRETRRDSEKAVAVRKYVPNFLSIKAKQIHEWAATTLPARQHLPVLLRRLANSTGHDLRRVDFPGYDNAERKGPDGIIEAGAATAWIPAGVSYWEFGVNKNPQGKADGDYAARVASVPNDERAKSTFVFVTPRNWPGKNAWCKDKQSAKEWKNVRAFDASDLEQWLEESVVAQIWLAEQLGMPKGSYETLDHCWERWAAGSEPPMTPELFAPSIAAHEEAFKKWLSQDSVKPFVVTADSRDEALAFLACMFRRADAQSRFKDLAAVFATAETLRTLAPSTAPFIPIVSTEEAERELATVYRKHHSIVVRPRNAVDSEPNIALDLLGYDVFEKALGAMSLSGDRVERLARESGRSPTILRRRLSSIDAIRSPLWAKDPETARALIPMMLVGAWNTKSNADTEVLSVFRPYKQVEEDIARLVQIDDPPVWSAGNYRGVASKIDLLFALSKFITDKDLADFFTLAELVLSEVDPALELPEADRWMAGIYGKVRDHSAALRGGICETLVILSVHGNTLFKERLGIDLEARVGQLVRQLLTPITLEKLMSHERDLPRYAEAAPETLLTLLEADLRRPEPVILSLLNPATSGIFANCPRAGLLWALECLAWNPQHLARVVSILGQLSRAEITDNWANKPVSTLEAIFKSWMPQTAASLEQRTKALRLLTSRHPDIGWQICIEQFDSGPQTGHYSYRPHWRSDASGAGQLDKTDEEIFEFGRYALDLALAWPQPGESMLGDLVERLGGMPKEDQGKVWVLIDEWGARPETTDSAKATLRERIRKSALTRAGLRRVPDEATREQAREAYRKLESSDPVIRHGWLFADSWVHESADELNDADLDYNAREQRIDSLRREAFRDIWSQRGFDGIAALLVGSNSPSTVGHYACLCVVEPGAPGEFLESCLALPTNMEKKADTCVAGFLWPIESNARQGLLRAVAERVDANRQVRLFKSAPLDKVTWQAIDERYPELAVRYWSEVFPQWNRRAEGDLDELVERLLGARRPRAAFYAAHTDWERLETSLLRRLLTDVATVGAEAEGTYRLDAYYISEALDELDGRAGVTVNEMAQLELLFVSALDHSKHGIPNIERQLAESPVMYMQVMALLWKRRDDGEDPPEWRIADPERRRAAASVMHDVLRQMKRIPGTNADGQIAASDLLEWLNQVRSLSAKYGRVDSTDRSLGELLANAPPESGAWPSKSVCEVLERIASPEIARGFEVRVRNSRGAHWRGEGGAQERELAARYRGWSQKRAFEYPYVANVLEEIAAAYDREAEWQDSQAKIGKRLRH
jgi:addiction module HigA family antidote